MQAVHACEIAKVLKTHAISLPRVKSTVKLFCSPRSPISLNSRLRGTTMDHILADGVLVDICLGLLPELDVAAASRSTQRSKPN